MCSIVGMLTLPSEEQSSAWPRVYRRNILRSMMLRAEDRGRDSWGYATPEFISTGIGRFSEYSPFHDSVEVLPTGWVIANLRAEPTTEFVKDKTPADTQPFKSGSWYIVHNGTIANDRELVEKYQLSPTTNIDSEVIACLIAKLCANDASYEEIAHMLYRNLKGSFSLAVGNASRPNELLLMCNYKPMYVARFAGEKFDQIRFASLPEYFQDVRRSDLDSNLIEEINIQQLPPFHAAIIGPEVENPSEIEIREIDLRKAALRYERTKCLVVASGGLDSTVVAKLAVDAGYDVTLLHFQYQCRAQVRENAAIDQIARALGCDVIKVPTDIFKSVIGGSSLTSDLDKEISKGDSGVEFAHEWVPARNLIMLSIATGIAEARGFNKVMLGNNLEESGAYPDNEMMFIRKLNEVMPYAVNVDKQVELDMPVGNLMKWEIVKLGLQIGAPLEECWSCYEAGLLHCGECGPCRMRRVAFEMNGSPDVIEYLVD